MHSHLVADLLADAWTRRFTITGHPTSSCKLAIMCVLCRYVSDFEGALFGSSFADANDGWRKFADEEHWVNWFLAIELVRNVKHSYHSSAFIQKVHH